MAHTILGTDDSINTCDCCGKSGLKHTVIVSVDGEVMHYGSTCATRHTGKTASQITRDIQAADVAKVTAARAAYAATPEALHYEATVARANVFKIKPGREFMQYCAIAHGEAMAVARSIAAARGVEVYKLI